MPECPTKPPRAKIRLLVEPYAPVAVEGSVDFFLGRPLDANPYSREDTTDPSTAFESWRYGWLTAQRLGELRADEEQKWTF